MVVCMMNDNFYRSSGAAIAIRRIAQAMTDVEIYVAGCDNGRLQEDLSWVPAGHYAHFGLKTSNPIQLLRELLHFKRWVAHKGIALVHCHHRRLAVLLQLVGIRVLYTGQLAFPHAFWFRALSPRCMTAITPSVAENIYQATGRHVLACIGNPTPFPNSPPELDLREVSGKAICVARLDPVKGHTHLLAAWALLAARGLRYELNLIGEGPLQEKLQAQCAREGISRLVHFRGFTADVSTAIKQNLFAILVSEIEGQGIVTLEAAAQGRASLLTAVTGSVDLLPPDRALHNGVAFGNASELADTLEKWFAQPEAVREEGQRFFTFLKASSDPQRIAGEYRTLYQQVLERSR